MKRLKTQTNKGGEEEMFKNYHFFWVFKDGAHYLYYGTDKHFCRAKSLDGHIWKFDKKIK